MTFFNFLRKRLSNVSSPQVPSLPARDLDTPLPRRRRIHRRRPSGAEPSAHDPESSPSPPFVRRDSHKRSTSLSTPQEITDSVSYAKTCSAYLCGQAMSVRQLTVSTAQRSGILTTSETFQQAKANLLAESEVFEKDQVQWAGYLMEGSEADKGDPERARLFVQEGLEIMFAVDHARAEVDRICAL